MIALHVPREASAWFADVVRFIDLVLYVAIVALTIVVIRDYYKVHRAVGKGHRGLLPSHVWTIGVSYILLASQAMYQNYMRLGHGWTGYITFNLIAFAIGFYAMWKIVSHERKAVGLVTKAYVVEEYVVKPMEGEISEVGGNTEDDR